MYESNNIADKINHLLKIKSISQKNMLDACGLSKNAISIMLSRGSVPKADTLAKIADYLDCSIDYLLGRTDIPEINKPSEDVRIFKIAARDGEKEIELTAAQRAEIARIVENSKNDDNSDLF